MRTQEMPHKGLVESPAQRLVVAVVVFAVVATTIATASPVHARWNDFIQLEDPATEVATAAGEGAGPGPFDGAGLGSALRFTDALDEQDPPPWFTPPGWPVEGVIETSVISAPLPQAVATGIFMLAGNWIIAHLWKKRKI